MYASSAGWADVFGGSVLLLLFVALAAVFRYRADLWHRQQREIRNQERVALARELHDTVAHHVSAIAVQAQAGRALAATDPERAIGVLAVIEEAASRTLAEMRTMVGSLRAGAGADLAPQRGVHDIERLAGTTAGQIEVRVDVATDLGTLGPAVDAAVYRIAQESITNSARHARRARHVLVRVESLGSSVRVTVTDDGDGSDASPGQGYGLLGMAERAHLLGGSFHAGPMAPRGWRVTAELPRSTVPT